MSARKMMVYATTKNTGPSHHSDPIHLLYLGTSLDDAKKVVGDFAKYYKEEETWPTTFRYVYTALPRDIDSEMIAYYNADGWWYSIFMFQLEVK